MAREDPTDRGLLGLIGGAGDEQMPDREADLSGARGILSRFGQARGPERARDVDEDTRAIALAIDAARAMREREHPGHDLGQDARVSPPVLSGYRDQAAGVALVHSSPNKKGPLSGRPCLIVVQRMRLAPTPNGGGNCCRCRKTEHLSVF